MVGRCRLCGVVGELRDSHILSAWAFRRVLSRGSNPQSVLIENGTRRFTNDQDREHLLCAACEQRFGRWENHVSRLAVQPDGTSPALQAITVLAHRKPGEETPADGSVLGDETALFAASVLWRASVSSRPDVSLGPYAEEFRSFLSGAPARLDHARLMVHVIDPGGGPLAAEIASYAATFSASGCREHQFAVPGLAFTFRVGGAVQARYDHFCFIRTKRVWVIDGDKIARFVWNKYRAAKPVGKKWQARGR